jgi:hypothetical protein
MDSPSRLTTGQMMSLNHGKIALPQSLSDIINHHTMPACCLSKPYGNPHNPYFSVGHADKSKAAAAGRTMGVRRTVAAHTDDHIFQDLRKAFASIVKGKDGTMFATMSINRMIIPHTKVKEIAELFFQTMIQCPLQIDEYLKVLFTLKRPVDSLEDKIRFSFAQCAIETFSHPVQLNDTKISDGDTLTRSHREVTCRILAKLFAYDYETKDGVDLSGPKAMFSNYDTIKQKFFAKLITEITAGNADSIKLFANSLRILSDSGKYPTIVNDYQTQLNTIYNSSTFKLTARLAVKDFILDV